MGFAIHPLDAQGMREPQDRRRHCDACGVDSGLTRVSVAGGEVGLEALLCAQHASTLVGVMSDCVTRMRAASAAPTLLQGRRLRDGEALDVIRAWAKASGYPVSKQGSVSQSILDAYRAAEGQGLSEAPRVVGSSS